MYKQHGIDGPDTGHPESGQAVQSSARGRLRAYFRTHPGGSSEAGAESGGGQPRPRMQHLPILELT